MHELSEDQEMQLLRLYASLWELSHAEYFWHASVSGISFRGNHDLFETLYTGTEEHIHVLAEWMQHVGQVPTFHTDHLEDLGQVASEIPTSREQAHVPAEEALEQALAAKQVVVEEGKASIDLFGDDPTTEDVLIEITRGQEEHLYQLKQALEAADE